jgi:hypothetical protein
MATERGGGHFATGEEECMAPAPSPSPARARPWRSASLSRALDRCPTMAEPGPLSARQQRRWLSPPAPRRWLRRRGVDLGRPLPITVVFFFFYPNRIRVRVTFSVPIRNRFISFLIQSDQLLCVSFGSELDLHTRSSLALWYHCEYIWDRLAMDPVGTFLDSG